MEPTEPTEPTRPTEPRAVRPSLLDRITRLWAPARLQRWLDAHRDARGVRAFAVRQAAIILLTIRHLHDEEIARRAAALTYYTLLSLVPMLAVAFALFKAFGGLHQLEGPLRKAILENLAAGRAAEVGRWLDRLINRLSVGTLAGVGGVVLLYSVLGLLDSVGQAFNHIFGIEQSRPWHRRLAIYVCLVTLGPVLLGVSLSLSARVQGSHLAAALVAWLPFGVGRALIAVVSALAGCGLFVLAYYLIPNTRVRFRAALIGGLVAGLAWSAAKTLFLWATAGSARYHALYGALAALPLVIVWLYYSWVITLFGVTVTYANHSAVGTSLLTPTLATTPRFRLRLAARLVATVVARLKAQEAPPTAEQLAVQVGVTVPVVRRLAELLVARGLLAETRAGRDTGLVPGRDHDRLTVADVARALWEGDGVEPHLAAGPFDATLAPLLERAERASQETLDAVAVEELGGRPA